jgi:hypothetical protein
MSVDLERVKRRAGLIEEKVFTAQGDGSSDSAYNTISLGEDIVYDIITAEKNGATIEESTDYEWNTYRPYVEMLNDVQEGDTFYFEIQTKYGDNFIQGERDQFKASLKSDLHPYIDDISQLDNSPTIDDMVETFLIGLLLQDQAGGTALESVNYRQGQTHLDRVETMKHAIKRGGSNILDQSDELIERTDGSLVGGATLDDEQTTREDILEALHETNPDVVDFTGAVRN